MSKAKKGTKENPISLNDLAKGAAKIMKAIAGDGSKISIIDAQIKDDFCLYQYEVTSGKDVGFTHRVNGKGIIDDELKDAFSKLNVHLAVIDDVYKHSDIKIGNVDEMHNDELALLYEVTAFKIKGGEENESIILIGTKRLSNNSRMELESPKIPIDNLSSYKWYNELRDAANLCRREVVEYHDGKYTPVKHEEEEIPDPNQVKITFGPGDANDGIGEEEGIDDFENARV